MFDLHPGAVVQAAKEHRASLKSPPKTVAVYLASLANQELAQTAALLKEYALLL